MTNLERLKKLEKHIDVKMEDLKNFKCEDAKEFFDKVELKVGEIKYLRKEMSEMLTEFSGKLDETYYMYPSEKLLGKLMEDI